MNEQERLQRFQELMHAASSATGIDLAGMIQLTLPDGTKLTLGQMEIGNGTFAAATLTLQLIDGWTPPVEPTPPEPMQPPLPEPPKNGDLFGEIAADLDKGTA